MIKPKHLQKGDKIAAISLSWGGPGTFPPRYHAGVQQLEMQFGVKVVPTKHALKSATWLYQNPEARAADLHEALEDHEIKAIFSTIGGDDSVRTLPFIDLQVIKNNPKLFLGFSDSTITHFCFYKAGITSFYGPAIMTGFAENCGMHRYQIKDIEENLFSTSAIGPIMPNLVGWTSERLEWGNPKNQHIKRALTGNSGYRFLQGEGTVTGRLLGGCLEVLEFLKDTPFWVTPEEWKDKIMFIETSEMTIPPHNFRWILRNYAASGILKQINGLIFGRPYNNQHWEEYDEILLSVIREEEGLRHLPIITGMDFGHTAPIFTIPFGVNAEINCDVEQFSILESGVI